MTTHRAQSIIDAAKTLLEARVGPSGAKVYAHRRQSLSPTQDETPAYSVDYGEDTPIEPPGFLAGIWSALTVRITIKTIAPTGEEVLTALLDAREQTDAELEIAMFAPSGQKLGLEFVHGIRYGGVSEPDIDPEGEQFVGELACMWLADYQIR